MLFEVNFEVIEVFKSGARVTHLLRGKRSDVKKDVENFKRNAKDYQMVGKKTMIVWA